MTKKYNASSKSATQKTKKTTERSPAIQFYFKQFVGDENILCMDLDAVGAHILLMCYAGASEHRYKIRHQKDRIRKLIRCNDFDRFEIILAQLLEGAWKVSDDGEWIEQHGLKRSFLKQKEYSKAQSERAMRRWGNAERMPDVCQRIAEVMPNACSSSSSSSSSTKDLITNVIRSTNAHEKTHARLEKGDQGEKPLKPIEPEADANLPTSATISAPPAPLKKKKSPTIFDLKTSITREQYQDILSNPSLGGQNRAFLRFCVEQMSDWSLSSGKSKLDWSATLRNWIRKTRQDGTTPENFEAKISGQKKEQPKTFFELEEERHKNALANFLAKGEDHDKLN